MNETKTKTEPKFPHIKVRLNGDRKPYTLISRALHQMRKAGVSKTDRDAFFTEACAPKWDSTVEVLKRYVTVEP